MPRSEPPRIRAAAAEVAPFVGARADDFVFVENATTGATAVLSRPNSLKAALAYLQRVPGVHGAMIVRGDHIGVAGSLELAA